MSTIEFDQGNSTGISLVKNSGMNVKVSGRTLMISGNYDDVKLMSVAGSEQNIVKTGEGRYSLAGIASGIYVVKVSSNGNVHAVKVSIR